MLQFCIEMLRHVQLYRLLIRVVLIMTIYRVLIFRCGIHFVFCKHTWVLFFLNNFSFLMCDVQIILFLLSLHSGADYPQRANNLTVCNDTQMVAVTCGSNKRAASAEVLVVVPLVNALPPHAIMVAIRRNCHHRHCRKPNQTIGLLFQYLLILYDWPSVLEMIA